MRKTCLALFVLAIAACSAPIIAQCWGQRRGGAVAPVDSYTGWERYPDREPSRWYLVKSGQRVGYWDVDTQLYHPAENGAWGAGSANSPEEPPQGARRPAVKIVPKENAHLPLLPADRNFGVDCYKIKAGDGFHLGDKRISRQDAFEAVVSGLPEEKGKLRLTVIGQGDDRKKVVDALAKDEPDAAAVKSRVLLWSVPPDHWSLKDNDTGKVMYITDGAPTIYLQAPDGKVLYRENDFRPGDFGAIRKAIDSYDAKKDPGRAKPSPDGGFDLSSIPAPVWVALAGLGLIVFLQRRQ